MPKDPIENMDGHRGSWPLVPKVDEPQGEVRRAIIVRLARPSAEQSEFETLRWFPMLGVRVTHWSTSGTIRWNHTPNGGDRLRQSSKRRTGN